MRLPRATGHTQRKECWEIAAEPGIACAQGVDFSPLFQLMTFRADINRGPQRRCIEVLQQRG